MPLSNYEHFQCVWRGGVLFWSSSHADGIWHHKSWWNCKVWALLSLCICLKARQVVSPVIVHFIHLNMQPARLCTCYTLVIHIQLPWFTAWASEIVACGGYITPETPRNQLVALMKSERPKWKTTKIKKNNIRERTHRCCKRFYFIESQLKSSSNGRTSGN